ncbi:DUF177 domain-containing protein [Bacteroides sp. 51]|uniref:YceD family protein n=1 Tax=Bacteroides sp. 51 TaxID=2302938 RepID=UPI0013D1EF01|nr:DUF177 domain-containing protein [Bacteroides sp. 51]NDV84440.1 DUF177 domain-containing protein [Bacteroides sp. 51]
MGKFDKYRIDLRGMNADAETHEFLLDNLFFANIDGPEVQKGKLKVVLSVKKTSRAFDLDFQIEGIVFVPCDRCLDDVELPINTSEKLVVKLGREHGSEGDNIIIVPEDEGDINVAWLIYEFIALAIPMKHVHAPGKCNKGVTGKLSKHLRGSADEDKDEDMDDMSDEVITDDEETEAPTDPRWNELKKILDNN